MFINSPFLILIKSFSFTLRIGNSIISFWESGLGVVLGSSFLISLIYEIWFISILPIDILFNSETIPNVFISFAISLIKDLIYVPSLTLSLISAFSLFKLRISISLTLIFLLGISISLPSLAYL